MTKQLYFNTLEADGVGRNRANCDVENCKAGDRRDCATVLDTQHPALLPENGACALTPVRPSGVRPARWLPRGPRRSAK
jgi:hypothetical protein